MKPLRYIISCLLIIFTFVSCGKTENQEEQADKFVGIYSISVVEHIVWGNDSGIINKNETLTIKKLSPTKVQVYGAGIYTTGEVSGYVIQLEGTYASDGSGYFTTTFGTGILSGNILKFTANHTGKLAYNGILYPYRNSIDYTAVKQY